MKKTISLFTLLLLLQVSSAYAASISVPSAICTGTSTLLTIDTTGGTWSSSNTARATIDAGTGVITGVSAGAVTISYNMAGATFTTVIAVQVTPTPIAGATAICEGATAGLTNAMGSGTWSSASPAVATVGATSGILTGVSPGTVIITYTRYTGCIATRVQTINVQPSAIAGGTSACVGTSLTLTSTPAGGTWTSSNASVANIGSATGIANANVGGSTTISYSLSGGCRRTQALSVINLPAAISGTRTTCAGSTTTLTSTTSGGTWSSSNTSVATVGTGAGVVTGVSSGTATISYIVGTGCMRTAEVTVNSSVAAITGDPVICVGSPTTFTNASGGGTWSSSNTSKATVNASTGLVTGISAGTATISYKVSASCFSTLQVTVNAALAAITGTTTLCVGTTTTLSHAIGGGTWSSSNTAKATVDISTGVVTGISTGTATITYMLGSGCRKTITVAVNAAPLAIGGTATVCTGSTTMLTNASGGGTWSSSNTSAATMVSTSGLVTGVSAGTSTISYRVYTGCIATRVVTVTTGTSAGTITGPPTVDVGSTISLSNAVSGGAWTSSATALATVSSSGVVTGVAAGTLTISYTVSGTCGTAVTTKEVTVSSSVLCTGIDVITTFAGTGTPGYSGDGGPATAARLNLPHGIAIDEAGNAFIADYTHRIRKVDASGVITTIAGTGSYGFSGDGGPATAAMINAPFDVTLDDDGNIYFADGHNHRIRKISTSGIISTIAGSGIAGYTGDSAAATAARLRYPAGVALDSSGNIFFADSYNHCIRKIAAGTGAITTYAGTGTYGYAGDGGPATAARFYYPNFIYADKSTGDLYVTDNGNHCIRKINSSGIVTTIAGTGLAGDSGDSGAATAARLRFPAGITKDESGNIYIADHDNSKVKKINTSGIITTIAGTGTDGYGGDGGAATAATINRLTDVAIDATGRLMIVDRFNSRIRRIIDSITILGTLTLCEGATSALTASFAGGVWTSGNTSVATVGSGTGLVSGTAAGTAVISYNSGTGCTITRTVSVNAGIPDITGDAMMCAGTTELQTNAIGGGTRSSANPAIASISITTGIATGISAGTAQISYVVPGEGCFATRILTINATPAAITGSTTLITGSTTSLSSATSGGTWSCSHTAIATVGSGTGIVTGVSEGNAFISYIIPSGCYAICVVNVDSPCSGYDIITTFAGSGTSGYGGDGGPAISADLDLPHGLAIDASGNIFISDISRIRKIDASGIITTIAGTGIEGFSGDDGPATAAMINNPFDVTLDAAGNVYFADGHNHRIRKISTSGTITTIAGNGTAGYSGDGSAATAAMLRFPAGVTLDASGNIFVADGFNHCIRRIDAATGVISTYAGTDTFGYAGDGGPATAARFYFPNFLFTDPVSSDMYVTDNGNHAVRKINSSGIVSAVAGTGTPGNSGDNGAATAARLNFPGGVIKDAAGNIYIADYSNSKIRKISTSGIINTFAGTGVEGYSGDGGPATAATMRIPTDLEIDPSGRLFIVDRFNSRIRQIVDTLVILGELTLCPGGTSTLTAPSAGGIWTSSNTSVATIDSDSGLLTGLDMGTSVISYESGSGCIITTIVTINASIPAIGGDAIMCVGATAAQTNATSGGI